MNARLHPLRAWPTLNRLMLIETVINTVISIPMALLATWLAFPPEQPIPLWGVNGVAFDLIPSTIIPAVLMSLATTLGLRSRLRKGMTAAIRFSPPLPRRLPLRLLAIGIGTLAIMGPPALAALYLTWGGAWAWPTLMLFKVAYAVCVSILLTPFVVLAACRLDVPSNG